MPLGQPSPRSEGTPRGPQGQKPGGASHKMCASQCYSRHTAPSRPPRSGWRISGRAGPPAAPSPCRLARRSPAADTAPAVAAAAAAAARGYGCGYGQYGHGCHRGCRRAWLGRLHAAPQRACRWARLPKQRARPPQGDHQAAHRPPPWAPRPADPRRRPPLQAQWCAARPAGPPGM